MAAYGSIEELKNAINDSIYANDAGLVTAEVLQERMHDIIDTLNALGGGSGDLSALESANALAQIYAGANKVATEAWVGEQAFIPAVQKGANSGVAELDSGGKVPAGQLPAIAGTLEEYADLASFPVEGETGIIYAALDTDLLYRWNGSEYVERKTAATASGIITTNFSIVEEDGVLVIKYGATIIASIDSAGYLKTLDDIEAFATFD